MAFDQKTRNLLQRTVSACRRILDEEFAAQRRSTYAIYDDGTAAPIDALAHLPDEEQQTARLLRDRLDHLVAGLTAQGKKEADARKEAVGRLTREQAFTVLNRLAALRMAEERDIVLECVRRGLQSDGFELFRQQAGSAFGDQFGAYQAYLSLLFDELAIDLGVLFDRHDPAGLLFPRKDALEGVLKELGGTGSAMAREEITPDEFNAIWSEDETIGWIYQYYNDPDERKKMREESSAPRNSRELAVRNQFFTPRYVVEFLTDNTLGRIWYEMTRGKTQLKDQCRYLVRRPNEIFLQSGESAPEQPKQDNLSQEELLRQPVHIPNRPLKDPRTILMLDPACGSMHFGLYAFDLFELIYDEAWGLEDKLGADALSRPPGVKSLHATYADKDAFLKDVPSLIIEQNIHGIDIDPRAAQIAGLSLWLRAQKAWQRLGLPPAERPAIKRSNIVCAEPMPGEKERLREFVASEFPDAERGVCLRLLEAIFDKMQLAGEAGSLLKIEEEIRSAIDDARDAWQDLATRPPELFSTSELNQLSTAPELTGLEQAVSSLTTAPRHLTTDFWERIEERIYAALRDYAEQAENGSGFQRRLFAEDAARGFAFIDVCRKRYDVALMNPPFGDWSTQYKHSSKTAYPWSYCDILAAFVDRGACLLKPFGRVGAITSRTCFFLSTFSKWREHVVLDLLQPILLVDIGHGVMDAAMVESAAYVLENADLQSRQRSELTAIRLLEADDPDPMLVRSVENLKAGTPDFTTYRATPASFRQIPNAPFAYWASDSIRRKYTELPQFEQSRRTAKVGLQSSDDFRFVRTAWETPGFLEPEHWPLFAKGGKYNPFYSDIYIKVNWHDNGHELKAFALTTPGTKHWSRNIRSPEFYLRPGLTWPRRTQKLGMRVMPKGCLFSDKGPAIFDAQDDSRHLLSTLAILTSKPAEFLISLSLNAGDKTARSFEVGIIQNLPIPEMLESERETLSLLARSAWGYRRSLDTANTTSHAFYAPEVTRSPGPFADSVCAWAIQIEENGFALAEIQRKIDDIVYGLYRINDTDRANIDRMLQEDQPDGSDSDGADDEADTETSEISPAALVSNLIDYTIGSSLGRWDIRYATGEQAAPELPDPFAPLPVCPPGQLQNAQGLPAQPEDVPAAYPIRIPWDGILVDDPEHPLDLERRVREVIKIIWSGKDGGPTAEAIEHEACEILGVKSLRDYFRKPAGFFADHLKRYSKSRRQAPIYWPLSTASGSYSLWIYYHRLTADTLYKCIQQFVEPKRKEVDAELDRLGRLAKAEEIGTKERRQMEALEELRRELADFHSELEHWAPRWKPNLNDGVLITACPLWKLFRLPKWQKDLKACWSELEKGDYDWAHLAFTLWPDRVQEKCRKDRSLAIAHGLEEICEVKAPEPKAKRARKAKKAPSGELETAPLLDGTGATVEE